MEYSTVTAGEFCLQYGIGQKALRHLIHAGRVKVVQGSIPMRVYDPIWGSPAGLSPLNAEDTPALECCEVAEVLGLTSPAFRRMAERAKIPFHRAGRTRLYTVAGLRKAIAEREKMENGRLNSGVRPWLVEWGRRRLQLPWKPVWKSANVHLGFFTIPGSGMVPSRIPRILSPFEVRARYWMSRKMLNRLIRHRRLLTVEGLRRLRIYDPEWTSAVGLTVHNLEDVLLLRCGEVAVLLGISPRMVRVLAAQRKIRSRLNGKRRYFSLTAVREVLGARERGEQGRRKHGVQRRLLLKWAQEQLRGPNWTNPSRAA